MGAQQERRVAPRLQAAQTANKLVTVRARPEFRAEAPETRVKKKGPVAGETPGQRAFTCSGSGT